MDEGITLFPGLLPDTDLTPLTPLLRPMLVIATLAAIVASQALISGSFSIIRQVGCGS